MKKIDHTEYKTVSLPHKKSGNSIHCGRHDLFIVHEGLQCGNCMALVSKDVPVYTVFTDGSKEPF